jgi:DNA-directed RNA polymerase specialized sigma24 family protein
MAASSSRTSRSGSKALEAAAAQLSPADRALLELLYVNKLPAEAAAAALGINRGALYTRKTRLVQRLQALVDAGGAGDARKLSTPL